MPALIKYAALCLAFGMGAAWGFVKFIKPTPMELRLREQESLQSALSERVEHLTHEVALLAKGYSSLQSEVIEQRDQMRGISRAKVVGQPIPPQGRITSPVPELDSAGDAAPLSMQPSQTQGRTGDSTEANQSATFKASFDQSTGTVTVQLDGVIEEIDSDPNARVFLNIDGNEIEPTGNDFRISRNLMFYVMDRLSGPTQQATLNIENERESGVVVGRAIPLRFVGD